MAVRLFGLITTKHSTEYTVECLKSFTKTVQSRSDDVCILIDNDATWSAADVPAPFKLLSHTTPKTFSENGNVLLKKARELGADLYFFNNDLILTEGWVEALGNSQSAITSPLSTRELTYSAAVTVESTKHVQSTFRTAIGMKLEDYRGNELAFAFIADAHRRATKSEFLPTLVVPFFCVRMPYGVITEIGDFDTHFGIGGGEDYDYCLRALLAGFSVYYVINTYILHFGGKSTWSGAETKEAQEAREAVFKSHFKEKWGNTLTRFILLEDASAFGDNPELKALAEKREMGKLIVKAKAAG